MQSKHWAVVFALPLTLSNLWHQFQASFHRNWDVFLLNRDASGLRQILFCSTFRHLLLYSSSNSSLIISGRALSFSGESQDSTWEWIHSNSSSSESFNCRLKLYLEIVSDNAITYYTVSKAPAVISAAVSSTWRTVVPRSWPLIRSPASYKSLSRWLRFSRSVQRSSVISSTSKMI